MITKEETIRGVFPRGGCSIGLGLAEKAKNPLPLNPTQ